MEKATRRGDDGVRKPGILDQVTSVFARFRRRVGPTEETIVGEGAISNASMRIYKPADDELDAEVLDEEQSGSFLGELLMRRPVVGVVGALILFTIAAVWAYPMTATPPKATPVAQVLTDDSPTASPAAESETPTPTEPVSTASILQPGSTPISVVPSVPTPTRPAGFPTGNIPTPPPPPNTGYPNPGGSRADTPPIEVQTPIRAATPASPVNTPTGLFSTPSGANNTPAPTGTASNTPVPAATPTPGPTTISVSIPALSSGSGYYYIIQARSGTIAATWQIGGAGAGQVFLLQSTPYGGRPGIVNSQPSSERAVAQGNISSSKSTIAPMDSSAGSYYTLVFFYSGVNGAAATTASVSYTPQFLLTPAAGATTVSRTPTPTPASAGSVATPTYTGSGPTPTVTSTSSSGQTPTNTPVPPATATQSGYPFGSP